LIIFHFPAGTTAGALTFTAISSIAVAGIVKVTRERVLCPERDL